MHNSSILNELSKKSLDHEFYTPVPEGYEQGRTKYVVVLGTVMSGLGKGIFASSLARLLKNKGLSVSPIKLEGYLNIDSGTLNPYRHGEVFVLDDGTETDMDLGTYERILDQTLTKQNFLTNGQIFKRVLELERKGSYLGRDVQIIPHVTGEIKRALRELALCQDADVIFIEIGGTVGDLENMHYIEAMRELAYEEGKKNVCFICLTYVLEPKFLGEQKSKAAQIGVKKLIEEGIQPDIIACRAQNEVSEKVREKISIYTNVPFEKVISIHNFDSVYQLPIYLKEKGLDGIIVKMLDLENKVNLNKEIEEYSKLKLYSELFSSAKQAIRIGIVGKYTSLRDSYASIIKALEHAGVQLGLRVEIKWLETTEIEENRKSVQEEMHDIDGIIVPGGFGSRGTEGKIKCIQYARENKIPFLGICYGFQLALIEIARNVLAIRDANSTEIDPNTQNPVIDYLPEQLEIESLGANMRLGSFPAILMPGTLIWELYNKDLVYERHRHRYEFNNKYKEKFQDAGVIFSGYSPKGGLMEFFELKDHPFFVGTQAHPEFKSRPLKPAPLFLGLVRAAIDRKKSR